MHVNSTVCAIDHQEQDPLLPIEASFKPYYESKIYQCCYSQPKHIHIIAELNMILKKIRMEASCSKELDQKTIASTPATAQEGMNLIHTFLFKRKAI